MKNYLFIFILSLTTFFAKADEANTLWQLANHAYQNKNYEAAIHLYDSMLRKNIGNPELYYNAGNAYFKNHNLGMAIWCYEKANQLSPSDEEISTNLKIARLRLIDKVDSAPEFVLFGWCKGFLKIFSIRTWAIITVLCFWIMLCGWFLYYFTFDFSIVGKWLIWVGLILGICFLGISWASFGQQNNEKMAIVISTNTSIKSAPDESAPDLFLIHEGLKIKLNKSNGDWVNISIADGKVGWCKKMSVKNL
ncbi:MAG: hypothetical protein RL065_1961 [Bacteroidota bacterium]|jgi:hypothetical protein